MNFADFANKPQPEPGLGMDDTMSFGKFRGETLRTIIEIDPGYLIWISENTPTVIKPDVLERATVKSFTHEDFLPNSEDLPF